MINEQHIHNSSDTKLLVLSTRTAFGIGGRRLCFSHPFDKSKCVKVLRQDKERTIRIKKRRILPAWMHPTYDNNLHEMKILGELQKKMGSSISEHFPRCYGLVDTDLGSGLMLDLVRDDDGQISQSLRELISLGHKPEEFQQAFEELGDFLFKHVILTRNLLDHNIVVRYAKDGTPKMYLIDGFGDPAWLPFARWFKPIGRSKVQKRLREAWSRFETFAKKGGVTNELRENSTWGQGMLNHRD